MAGVGCINSAGAEVSKFPLLPYIPRRRSVACATALSPVTLLLWSHTHTVCTVVAFCTHTHMTNRKRFRSDTEAFEANTGKSRKRGAGIRIVEIVQGADLESTLNINGCASVPLTNSKIDVGVFIQKVDQGTHWWFNARMQSALSPSAPTPVIKTDKVPDAVLMAKWKRGCDDWDGRRASKKARLLAEFDLRTTPGRERLFIASKRKAVVKGFADAAFVHPRAARSEALQYYFGDRVRYVKQGDSRMGLSAMDKSWAESGFGKWAHITTSQGIRAAIALRETLQENNLDTQLSGGSHMIYKPPGGKQLPAHTDGPRPAAIIELLETFARLNDGRFPTTFEWMQEVGVQSLVHFDGGRVDGYTYSIGPMTPKKLYHCLKAVQDERLGVADSELFPRKQDGDDDQDGDRRQAGLGGPQTRRDRFLTGGSGPSFMQWKENIEAFNAVLADHDEMPIGVVPIRPAAEHPAGAFACIWPNGFPHGSAPNKKRRITTTASLAVVGPNYKARDERVVERVRALATLASLDSTEGQRERARLQIASQTTPFYGGRTHLHPERAATWVDPAKLRSGEGGFYRDIAPTPSDAALFEKEWEAGSPEYAPTAADWADYERAKAAFPSGRARRPTFETPSP